MTVHFSKKFRSFLSGVLLMIVTFFVCSVIADRVLILFKFPSKFFEQVAHPPYHKRRVNNLEFNYSVKVNSQGLRYREIPLEKPAGSYRVFVVGDSFIEGVGVEEDHRLTEFLEQTFSSSGRETRFVNGGLGGTGPYEYARIFLHVGEKYQPDALLICLYANDIRDTPPKIDLSKLYNISPSPEGYERTLYLIWPRTFVAVTKIVDSMAKKRETQTKNFIKRVTKRARADKIPREKIAAWKAKLPQYQVDAVNQGRFNGGGLARGLVAPEYWQESIDLDTEKAEKKFDVMIIALNEMVNYCRKNKMDVAVVYIPSAFQYDPLVYDPKIPNPYRISGVFLDKRWLTEKSGIVLKLESWAGSASVPFLDLTPALRQAVRKKVRIAYPLDLHFTAQGQRLAGEIIAQWIRKEKVFPIQ